MASAPTTWTQQLRHLKDVTQVCPVLSTIRDLLPLARMLIPLMTRFKLSQVRNSSIELRCLRRSRRRATWSLTLRQSGDRDALRSPVKTRHGSKKLSRGSSGRNRFWLMKLHKVCNSSTTNRLKPIQSLTTRVVNNTRVLLTSVASKPSPGRMSLTADTKIFSISKSWTLSTNKHVRCACLQIWITKLIGETNWKNCLLLWLR